MDEKVIIEGQPVVGVKLLSVIFKIVLVALCISIVMMLFIDDVASGFGEFLMLFVVIILVLLVVLTILKYVVGSYSIKVTDKRVYGTAILGRRVDLPLDSITSIGKVFNHGIIVSTPSGGIKFCFMKNDAELFDSISKLLVDRQNNNDIQQSVKTQVTSNETIDVTEELRKYKALLDDGVITNKEFEDKKKELLSK